MHAAATVERALALSATGMSTSAVAREMSRSRSTVPDGSTSGRSSWTAGSWRSRPDNRSRSFAGIQRLLCDHLDLLDIAWRRASARNIAITRRSAVARLDEFVGPKR
jgi:hypothetical protein